MKKSVWVIITVLILLSGCAVDAERQNNPQKEVGTYDELGCPALTEEDFDIEYKGIIINDKRPFIEIANELGVSLNSRENPNVSSMWFPTELGEWKTLYYPDEKSPDIIFYFAYEENPEDSWLVGIELLGDMKTNRGIGIWDYGYEITDAYYNPEFGRYEGSIAWNFPYDASGHPGIQIERYCMIDCPETEYNKRITFHVNASSGFVCYIWIDYSFGSTRERLVPYFMW